MKLNIANPATGLQKKIEFEDERKVLPFYGEKIGNKVDGDSLGDEFKDYKFRIAGGNDKQGFPMMSGVMTDKRVRILFKKGMKCFRARRNGQMRRKSVRGCIVSSEISVLNLTVYQTGDEVISGLNEDSVTRPNRLGPKRAGRIRKQFGLRANTDLRPFVVRRVIEGKEGKKNKNKAPKIQRLVTKKRVARKKHLLNVMVTRRETAKKNREQYDQMMQRWQSEQKEARMAQAAKKKKIAAAGAS